MIFVSNDAGRIRTGCIHHCFKQERMTMISATARSRATSYRASAIVALAAAIFAPFGGARAAEAAEQQSKSDIPEDLRVEGPRLAIVHASGFQVYTCSADATGKLAWTLKAPDATFENAAGWKGKHYAGPTWEAADGSKVVGRKLREHASSDAKSVPWLLLDTKSHEGSGKLAGVTFIQRIHTSGGKPPPIDGAKAGAETRVPYTADYVFYGPGATTPAAKP
jgi:hypothetical protein